MHLSVCCGGGGTFCVAGRIIWCGEGGEVDDEDDIGRQMDGGPAKKSHGLVWSF